MKSEEEERSLYKRFHKPSDASGSQRNEKQAALNTSPFSQDAYYMKLYNSKSKGRSGLGLHGSSKEDQKKHYDRRASPHRSPEASNSKTSLYFDKKKSSGLNSSSNARFYRKHSRASLSSSSRSRSPTKSRRRHSTVKERDPSYPVSVSSNERNSKGKTLSKSHSTCVTALKEAIRKKQKDSQNDGSSNQPLPAKQSWLMDMKKLINDEDTSTMDLKSLAEANIAKKTYEELQQYIDDENSHSLSAVLDRKRAKLAVQEEGMNCSNFSSNTFEETKAETGREYNHLDAIFGDVEESYRNVQLAAKRSTESSSTADLTVDLLADSQVMLTAGMSAIKERAKRKI